MTDYLGIVGIAIGIVGIVLSIVIARRYSERKEPTGYSVTWQKIAQSDDAPRDIQIAFKGREVKRVSSSFVWFWNEGRKPIRRDDIPVSNPLVLRVRDSDGVAVILDHTIRKVSREATRIQLDQQDETTLRISFDFLDYQDGFAVELQHTGGPFAQPEIDGIVLGAPGRIVVTPGFESRPRRRYSGPLLPESYHADRYRESARRSTKSRVKATSIFSIILAGFLGLALFAPRIFRAVKGGEAPRLIEVRTDSLETVLAPFLQDSLRQAALARIVSARVVREYPGPLAITIVSLAIWCIGMLTIWSREHLFPDSLLLMDTRNLDGGGR